MAKHSVMVNQFKMLPDVKLSRNTFDTSFEHLTDMDAGKIYPVGYYEIIPGQTLKVRSNIFGRLNTLKFPAYANLYIDLHAWYTPNRLVWDKNAAFLGESWNPYSSKQIDTSTLVTPIVNPDKPAEGFNRLGFFDYLSIPPAIPNQFCVAFYPRNYNLIWNCYYRSEQLQPCVDVPTGDGPDVESDYPLLPRGKRFDYFTSMLPEPQNGESVYLPLGSDAPVITDGKPMCYRYASATASPHTFQGRNDSTGLSGVVTFAHAINNKSSNFYYGDQGLKVDLSEATSLTIQAFRNIIALNQFLERENRYGTRLQELILAHFGVTAPDYRLQMPEYLGGTTLKFNISSVPQTSSTDNSSPQGTLAAFGTVAGSDDLFFRSFVEHGTILFLASIRSELLYQEGVDRALRRRKKLDYCYPEFSGISDQEIYNYELYVDGTAEDDEVVGYNERFAEYRTHNSHVVGALRSSYPTSLDYMHLAQYWGPNNRPLLNADFIVENPPINRIVALKSTEESYRPQFTVDFFYDVEDTLPIPKFGIPGLERL